MGLIQNLAIVALFSGAYISNPDEESFKRHLEAEFRRSWRLLGPSLHVIFTFRGHASWLEAKLASILTANFIKKEVCLNWGL